MSNEIAPTAIIGPNVAIGEDNYIGAYSVIEGNIVIGKGNWIGPHVVIGTPWVSPSRGSLRSAEQDSPGPIRIGNNNTIREFTAIQAPIGTATRIGNGVYVMEKAHVPHDCVLEDRAVLSSGVILGGHTRIGEGANLGLGAITHQRIVVGALAMVGMGSIVTSDIPPGALAYGSPARVMGANKLGLTRWGLDEATIEDTANYLSTGGEDGRAPETLVSFWKMYHQRIQELQERD